jgi:glyoxylase-like metal-dependent hydrolase (beta-lactamase superfamily II)
MSKTLIAGLLLFACAATQAQDTATSFKSTEVASGIYMLEGADGFGGGNISLLVGDDKIVLIDDAMVPTAPALLEAALEVAGRPIDFVINTHLHGDHTGGNALLSEDGAVVFAHDNIRKRLLADPTDAGGPAGLPVVTFSEELSFHVNGMTAHAFHLERAHTDGDAAIHFVEANVIHAGDVMFNKLFPYIDLDNGGSVDGYIAGQERLYSMADENTVLIPGHGALASKADLRENLDVLIDCKARVAKLVAEGKSIDEVLEINPLADYHDTYNWSFITTERMTRTLYRGVSGQE